MEGECRVEGDRYSFLTSGDIGVESMLEGLEAPTLITSRVSLSSELWDISPSSPPPRIELTPERYFVEFQGYDVGGDPAEAELVNFTILC